MQFDCINFHYDICKVVLQLLAYDTYSKLIMMMMMMNNDKNNPAVLPWNLQACCHPCAALCQTILDLVAAGDDAGGTGDNQNSLRHAELRSNHHQCTDTRFITSQILFVPPRLTQPFILSW